MYVVEGAMTVQLDTDAALGKTGVYVATDTGFEGLPQLRSGLWVYDSAPTARWHTKLFRGLARLDAYCETITTPTQAAAYTGEPLHRYVFEESPERPDIAETIETIVPEGGTLVEASANLWREGRFPTAAAYVGALGRLQDGRTYSPEDGWQPKYDVVRATRLKLGVMFASPAPRLELSMLLQQGSVNYAELNERRARWGLPPIPIPGDDTK